MGFYRTYEELKLVYKQPLEIYLQIVFIVPMRN